MGPMESITEIILRWLGAPQLEPVEVTTEE